MTKINKNSEKNNTDNGWGPVFRWILRGDLSKNAKLIYSLLSSYQGNKKECFPSLITIEQDLKIRRASMLQALKELERAKIIKIHKNPGRVNIYELTIYRDTSDEPEPRILTINNNIKKRTFKKNNVSFEFLKIEEFNMCVCEQMFNDKNFIEVYLRENPKENEEILKKKISDFVSKNTEEINGLEIYKIRQLFINKNTPKTKK
jgi:hypothetical protein